MGEAAGEAGIRSQRAPYSRMRAAAAASSRQRGTVACEHFVRASFPIISTSLVSRVASTWRSTNCVNAGSRAASLANAGRVGHRSTKSRATASLKPSAMLPSSQWPYFRDATATCAQLFRWSSTASAASASLAVQEVACAVLVTSSIDARAADSARRTTAPPPTLCMMASDATPLYVPCRGSASHWRTVVGHFVCRTWRTLGICTTRVHADSRVTGHIETDDPMQAIRTVRARMVMMRRRAILDGVGLVRQVSQRRVAIDIVVGRPSANRFAVAAN